MSQITAHPASAGHYSEYTVHPFFPDNVLAMMHQKADVLLEVFEQLEEVEVEVVVVEAVDEQEQ